MTSNVRLTAAKIRFTQSKFRMLHALCSDKNLRAGEKRKTSVCSQTLSSRFIWPVNAYFCPRYFTGIMDEKMVKRQHFSMVFDSLNNGTVYFTRNTFIVDKMK